MAAGAMVALIWKTVDLLKYLSSWSTGGKNGAITILTVWVAGIVAVLLYSRTDWAGVIDVGGLTLLDLNIWSQLALGLAAGGVTSVGFDFKKAVDPSDSAKTPALMPDTPTGPPPPEPIL